MLQAEKFKRTEKNAKKYQWDSGYNSGQMFFRSYALTTHTQSWFVEKVCATFALPDFS